MNNRETEKGRNNEMKKKILIVKWPRLIVKNRKNIAIEDKKFFRIGWCSGLSSWWIFKPQILKTNIFSFRYPKKVFSLIHVLKSTNFHDVLRKLKPWNQRPKKSHTGVTECDLKDWETVVSNPYLIFNYFLLSNCSKF